MTADDEDLLEYGYYAALDAGHDAQEIRHWPARDLIRFAVFHREFHTHSHFPTHAPR